MSLQNFELKNEKIRAAFTELKKVRPERFAERLNLSWSNWGFGTESLSDSAKRLQQAGIGYIELKGNHHGPDLGYGVKDTLRILAEHDLKVSGICGMFSVECDLSSNRPFHRQTALEYLKREIEFAAAVGASYMLIVPGAPGRTKGYDAMELERSVETLLMAGDLFLQHGIKAAVEPIRSDEVSFIHTVADAQNYIRSINHPGVQSINGDVYHMQSEEQHIGEALLSAGEQLVNLHMADSNRRGIGEGSMDLDIIIMALYLLDYNCQGKFVTLEPLLSGVDMYTANYGSLNQPLLDRLVQQSSSYFREREGDLLR
ncbi:sugar phosphate isomerase/epimerase family protein [Paenibacillus sp. Soil787]|uniref:sugar phosphate isomerase/epimerase family protein n=1 Tax=Paenibacillus sp. Soil787 TaxID=1736411 RepID=UPI0007C83C06|nr:sugar phosphate isomerase/epimerase family protein [Paenibacillus sp. Soil787]